MKWFVYQLFEQEKPSKIMYVNARTRNAANKRLEQFLIRFKYTNYYTESLADDPLETLVHCWNKFGQTAVVVYKDD
jgi:hypothetical protein